jgi:methylglutamate dehydrogenase subunit D
VPEATLIPRSGLEHLAGLAPHGGKAGAPGVSIAPRPTLALASIVARNGKIADASNHAAAAFGVALPLTPRHVEARGMGFVWAGPGQWLAIAERIEGHILESRLRWDFAGLAAVTDQSDGHSVVRVSGPWARETLAKGIAIDLDPRAFAVGDAALTMAGHINVHLWQIDTAPTYEIAIFRSLAAAFCTWLLQAAGEFDAAVTGPAGSTGGR